MNYYQLYKHYKKLYLEEKRKEQIREKRDKS